MVDKKKTKTEPKTLEEYFGWTQEESNIAEKACARIWEDITKHDYHNGKLIDDVLSIENIPLSLKVQCAVAITEHVNQVKHTEHLIIKELLEKVLSNE